MAKRNISEEINQITFPDTREYQRFEELILSGNSKDYQEAFKMLKNKIDSKKRRKVQVQSTKGGEILW